MKIQIDKVYTNWEKKDGTKYVSKFGKPFAKVTVKATDGEYYSCFDFNGQTKDWQDGQTIDVEIEEKDGFKNIVLPKVGTMSNAKYEDLDKRLRVVEEKLGIPTHGTLEFKNKDKDFHAAGALVNADAGEDMDWLTK